MLVGRKITTIGNFNGTKQIREIKNVEETNYLFEKSYPKCNIIVINSGRLNIKA